MSPAHAMWKDSRKSKHFSLLAFLVEEGQGECCAGFLHSQFIVCSTETFKDETLRKCSGKTSKTFLFLTLNTDLEESLGKVWLPISI